MASESASTCRSRKARRANLALTEKFGDLPQNSNHTHVDGRSARTYDFCPIMDVEAARKAFQASEVMQPENGIRAC
jgi:hypothetical protein